MSPSVRRPFLRRLAPAALTVVCAALLAPAAGQAATWPTPLPLGKEAMYAEFNDGDIATADNLLRDVWPARLPRQPVALAWPLTWPRIPTTTRNWRFYFYALRPTSSLLWAYDTTGARRYLDRLIAILRSFEAYDEIRPVNPLTFDNKRAAAYRAMVLVNHYAKLKRAGVLPADLDADIRATIGRLGTFLAVRSNWEDTHNHGFNEAAALLLIAVNFPDLPVAAEWRKTGADRLLAMLANTIDADGVEVENSPFYHVYVLGMVAEIATWAARYEPAISGAYATAARKMLRYGACVTEPNGALPMLGATATTNLANQDPAVHGPLRGVEPAYDWVFTSGAEGTPPTDGTALFPVAGLFTLRSPLAQTAGKRTDQTFATFDAGVYRTDHSHLDALAITLYSHGAPVLPDMGLFTYDKGTDYDYFHGTRAHNTVMVDGASQPEGAATPGPYGKTPTGATWASGTSRLYAGVRHDRTVVILRQGLTVVLDQLASARAHDYAQMWHMPRNSRVATTAGGALVADAAGQPSLAIAQADGSAVTAKLLTGATNPMQGWYSQAYGFKFPAPALEYHRTTASLRLATALAAGPDARAQPQVRARAIAGGREIAVCVGATGDLIDITAEGSASERVTVSDDGCEFPVSAAVAAPGAVTPMPTPTRTPGSAAAAAPAPPCRPTLTLPARSVGSAVRIRYRACARGRLVFTLRRAGHWVLTRRIPVATGPGRRAWPSRGAPADAIGRRHGSAAHPARSRAARSPSPRGADRGAYPAIARASSTSRPICSTSASIESKRFSPRSRLRNSTRSGSP